MNLASFAALFLLLSVSHSAYADAPPSIKQPNFFSWMHGAPVGEQPGWSESNWINLELNEANVWNIPMTMQNKTSGQTYTLQTDYEQTSSILSFGHGFGDTLGATVELPFAVRWGGFMDHFINAYHHVIDNNFYERDINPQYQTITNVQTDGVQYFSNKQTLQSISNIDLKLKLWLLHWYGTQSGSCPCGLSIGSQTKIPMQDSRYGGTTGHVDQTAFVYLGVPLFDASAFWATASYSWLGENPAIEGWPRFKNTIMYEGAFDIAVSDHWGLIFMVRAESPILDENQLTFVDNNSTDPDVIQQDKVSSGWNSLVHWRGAQSFGIRYRADGGNQFQFVAVEDFGVGPFAQDGTGFYSTNAPDFDVVLQLHMGF